MAAALFFALVEVACWRVRFLGDVAMLGSGGRMLPLDGLRGYLAFAVFYSHAAVHQHFWEKGEWVASTLPVLRDLGTLPVLLFFFLSGFLFWNQIQNYGDAFPLKAFFAARMRRILPAYYLSVAFVLFFSLGYGGFAMRDSFGKIAVDAAAWLAFGMPWMTFPAINQAIHGQVFNAAIAWTLYYEWTFYFSLPLLRWFRKGSRVLGMLAGLVVLYVGLRRFVLAEAVAQGTLGREANMVLGYLTYMATGFGVGILASYLKKTLPASDWYRSKTCATLALLSLAMAFIGFQTSNGPLTLLINRLWLLFFFFPVAMGNSLFGGLTSRGAQLLGKVSYSLYVLHGVVLFAAMGFVNSRWPVASLSNGAYWSIVFVVAMAVVVVSTLSYWFVERPFLKVKATSRPEVSPKAFPEEPRRRAGGQNR